MAIDEKFLDKAGLIYYDTKVKARDAQKSELPTKITDLNNDGNFVQDAAYKHTDNNYTTAEKTKLAGIDESADANLIESVKVNGAPLEIDSSKAVNITVPTDNSSLANGAGYQTATDVNNLIDAKGYQTASQVNSIVNTAVANAAHLKRAIVDVLPESGEENTIYLVPSASSKDGNVKDEYMWINSAWEKIGSSEVDLTGYLKESDLTVITTAEINAMFA